MIEMSLFLKEYFEIFVILGMTAIARGISYYLSIVIEINKKLGGKRGWAEADAKDKFLIQKENISKEIQFVKAKLQERLQKTKAEVLGINKEVKDKIQSIYNQIERMRQFINKENITNETVRNIKLRIVDQLKEKTQRLEDQVQRFPDKKNLNGLVFAKTKTLTETKQLLLEHDGKINNTDQAVTRKQRSDNRPAEIQLVGLERLKKNDILIDERLDDLHDKTRQWHIKLKQTGKLIDDSNTKIEGLTTQVDKVNNKFVQSNKELKSIIQQYRKPHKFCIDIILILVLIGIIVGIIKVSKG